MPSDLLLSLNDPGPMGSPWIMMIAFAAIFYFVIFRPQQKEQKDHQALVASLQKGDRVVTGAGIHGRVHEAKADTLVLEIAPNTFLTVDRETVRRKVTDSQASSEKS